METIEAHIRRLRALWRLLLAGIAALSILASLASSPSAPPLAQGHHFLWIFAALSVLNLVTVMPLYRATLAGPRRVFAIGQRLAPLLRAHFAAHAVAMARVEAIAVLGLVLHLIAGKQEWFWPFAAVALIGLLLLYPTRGKTVALASDAGPVGRPLAEEPAQSSQL